MKLGDRHREAIRLYIKGEKVTDLCKEIGIARRTFYDWMEDDTFKSELLKMD